jgi:signal transduction histidine kinase
MPSQDDAIRVERERIAREIHDLLGHHLTVVALHAGATEGLAGMPDAGRSALQLIRRSATDALRDLRLVLESLDADPQSGETAANTPLEQLDSLISGVAAAGLHVELTLGGSPGPDDSEVSRTAIRIIQEALTNSLRHGRATGGRVALSYQGDSLTIEVVDNGLGVAPQPAVRRTHRGLRGMQERVSSVCGDLQVGPVSTGGYRVWARLPRLASALQAPI